MSIRRIAGVTAVASLVAVAAVGCGSSSSSSTKPAAAPGTAQAANPNAPEVKAGGDIPDTQAYVRYSPAGASWSVKVPEGWSRTDVTGGAVFTDKFNSVEAASAAASSGPTVASAQRDEVPKITASATNVTNLKVSQVTRTAGPAVLITYQADSSVNQVTGKSVRVAVERYEFFRNGTQVTLTLTGPVGADNVDPWKTVTNGFSW